jgi:hypothetical protein
MHRPQIALSLSQCDKLYPDVSSPVAIAKHLTQLLQCVENENVEALSQVESLSGQGDPAESASRKAARVAVLHFRRGRFFLQASSSAGKVEQDVGVEVETKGRGTGDDPEPIMDDETIRQWAILEAGFELKDVHLGSQSLLSTFYEYGNMARGLETPVVAPAVSTADEQLDPANQDQDPPLDTTSNTTSDTPSIVDSPYSYPDGSKIRWV